VAPESTSSLAGIAWTLRELRARIAFRYFAVELLTAFFFLIIWKAFPWPIAVAYWDFICTRYRATFIYFEHFIIPDEITIGGTPLPLIASIAVPPTDGHQSRLPARGQSSA